jgi:hypothetical protein
VYRQKCKCSIFRNHCWNACSSILMNCTSFLAFCVTVSWNFRSAFLKIGQKMTFDKHPWKIFHDDLLFFLNDLEVHCWKCIVSVMFCVNLSKFSIVEIFLLQLLCCSWRISHYFLCKYELLITNFSNNTHEIKCLMTIDLNLLQHAVPHIKIWIDSLL